MTDEDRLDLKQELARIARERDVPEWVLRLVRLLDELVRIPGTDVGVGLDAILGFLLPGAGDSLTAVASTAILVAALRRGVPGVILFRMVMNILVDLVLGSVPVVGDVFDLFFRSNKRNLVLLETYEHEAKEPTTLDYAIVALGITFAAATVLVPILLAVFLGAKIAQLFAG
ncbi:MAG: DUF4112 domain-containing protein [Polyangiales bacterium]